MATDVGDPNTQNLFRFLLDYIGQGDTGKRILQICTALVIANIPGIVTWFSEWRKHRGQTQLYERMLTQNKEEIERQKDRIKELENKLLKVKRQ